MITVPPQELAVFLGNHLDHVLQQTGLEFDQSVAANRQFRAGCALMDVLNAVESVQGRIRAFLQERRGNNGNQGDRETTEPVKVRITSLYLLYNLYRRLPIHLNPFLCLFVDIYTTSLLDEQQRPVRYVVSMVLSGDGKELGPRTPSELIRIGQEAESKQVDLHFLDGFLPDVPPEDQIVPGLGWESVGQQRRDDHERAWNLQGSFGGAGRLHVQGDHIEDHGSSLLNRRVSTSGAATGITSGTPASSQEPMKDTNDENEEEELEEWEIEAEKHLQGSEDVAPAPAVTKPKKLADAPISRHQLNMIMEDAAIQPLTFDQEQFMLSQFNADAVKVHIPLPLPETLPGIADNNPTIAFNLLLYLIQLSSDLDGGDDTRASQRSNGAADNSGRASARSSSFSSPEPTIVDAYLDTMTYSKRLTLHSLEVVNRLTLATTLSPRFLHAYIENAIRCCELVEDKVGQARVVRMLCKFLQSLLKNGAITIPGYYHALNNFCVQFARVKEVADLFQSLVEYQRKTDTQSPVQVQGPSIRTTQQPPPLQQQQQQASRTLSQSASVPSTPTTDTPQRSSWLASSGSIANVKSTLSKHHSLNGFSTPGALSQFIHPGPASPAGTSANSSSGGSTSNQNGGSYSSSHSFSNGSGSGSSYFKTHHKHSSQHSSSTGSLFSSPTVMSASVNAFNSGLGNPTSMTLNGGNSSSNNNSTGGALGSFRSRSISLVPSASASASGSTGTTDGGYDPDGTARTNPRDPEPRSGGMSSLGSAGSGGSSSAPSSGRALSGSQQQQQQQQQTVHLGPKGFNTASHLGNHARGRGARRGG
ncbi:hypothetical protein B0O80DRAFT_497195 [Mortierella sp. GBAus27b]|nr:hypothetical protein B0O80DRAFT_497195 [Mortierella sp. GBAus27b]